jgi:tetratricopeptide (TPR) repeat protein
MILGVAFAAGFLLQALTSEVARHAQAGLKAEKQGHPAEAIAEFKRVTELAPELAAGFANLGAAYIQARDYTSAVPPLEKALTLNPELVGVHQMLGYALLMEGDARRAIPHLERAGAKGLLGVAQLKTGALADAVMNLSAELSKHPNDPDLLYFLGRAAGLLSKEAIDSLESEFPNSARSHQALAENYAALRQVSNAANEYLQAIRLQPDTRGLHLELGQLYASASDWAKAEEQYRAEAKLEPADAESAYYLGYALLQEGKIEEAESELKRANALKPDMPETLYALGKAESIKGDDAAAEKCWTQVVALEKASDLAAQAHFSLARLYRKQGRTTDAEHEMQEYARLHH